MRANTFPRGRRYLWVLVTAVPLVVIGLLQLQNNARAQGPGGQGQGPVVYTSSPEDRAPRGYWTKERMQNAKPRSVARAVPESQLGQQGPAEPPPGPPGFTPGSRSGGEPQSRAEQTDDADIGQPQHGIKPTNPKDGPYGPFQRFSLIGKYTNYPARTIGRLFFTLNGGNFACSASTIGLNKIVTAGHCISDGTSTFGSNFTFCPAWRPSGPNPAYGCWDLWTQAATSGPWHFSGNLDYDYAVINFGNDGVCACPVGNAVGWMGYGWNWGTSQPDMAFGYPAGAPFNGHVLIQVASTDWYTQDWNAADAGQVSKVMGNDMTGGSSGGPWVLGWRHPSAEVVDTDASNGTDPAGPFVNGINSNKRCASHCGTPPTTTSGLFWQEMISPPFENNPNDPNDVTDVITLI